MTAPERLPLLALAAPCSGRFVHDLVEWLCKAWQLDVELEPDEPGALLVTVTGQLEGATAASDVLMDVLRARAGVTVRLHPHPGDDPVDIFTASLAAGHTDPDPPPDHPNAPTDLTSGLDADQLEDRVTDLLAQARAGTLTDQADRTITVNTLRQAAEAAELYTEARATGAVWGEHVARYLHGANGQGCSKANAYRIVAIARHLGLIDGGPDGRADPPPPSTPTAPVRPTPTARAAARTRTTTKVNEPRHGGAPLASVPVAARSTREAEPEPPKPPGFPSVESELVEGTRDVPFNADNARQAAAAGV